MQLVLLIKTNYILKSILFGYLLFTSGFVFPSSLTITPDFETEGVGTYFDDAADDPAIWFNSKDPKKSLRFFNKAIKSDPNYALAYYNRGIAKTELKDYYGAISDYNKSLEIDPNDNKVYNNRGIAKRKIGDDKGGCDDYKKAISLGHKETEKWFQTDGADWCRNM